MTTALDLRADQRRELAASGDGVVMTMTLPATGRAYDPATGGISGGTQPAGLTGFGRVSRFSDAIAAGGLIDNTDSLLIFIPDETSIALQPANDAVISTALVSGPQAFRVISFTPRYLAGDVIHYRIQGRR